MKADYYYWKLTEHLEQLHELIDDDFMDLIFDPNETLFRFERATSWLDELEEFASDLENFMVIYIAENYSGDHAR